MLNQLVDCSPGCNTLHSHLALPNAARFRGHHAIISQACRDDEHGPRRIQPELREPKPHQVSPCRRDRDNQRVQLGDLSRLEPERHTSFFRCPVSFPVVAFQAPTVFM
jgi:hypothetical protein